MFAEIYTLSKREFAYANDHSLGQALERAETTLARSALRPEG